MGSIGQDVSKSLKDTTRGSGKKVLHEPIEILKTAGSQLSSGERTGSHFDSKEFYEKTQREEEDISSEERDNIEAKRRKMLKDLKAEIQSIGKEREEKDRQRKEAFTAKQQEEKLQKAQKEDSPAVSSKQSRKLRIGMSGRLDKLKRKSEIRMPPSG